MTKQLWFKRKSYGWGWTPITWQGWLVVLSYIGAVITIASQVDKTSHSISDTIISAFGPIFFLTIFVIKVCYLKGEKPRWQWGSK